MKITFFGAARTVTGSKHLLEVNGLKILLDCGFFQGRSQDNDLLNRNFGFNPAEIDYLILSHAHIDHSGAIPLLVKKGFKGTIFCTPATYDLCEIMLTDSAHIQEYDVKYVNKKLEHKGLKPIEPLYTIKDALHSLSFFKKIKYRTEHKINNEFSFKFFDAGHILGSAAIFITYIENKTVKKLCFTGDIGRYNSKILKDPEPLPSCNHLIMESTYGNRLHEDNKLSTDKLLEIVKNTCVNKKGRVIIPAFSLGRTQELVYALDRLETEGELPRIPVFVDSPLSTKATQIMKNHPECFNEDLNSYLKIDSNPFGFENLFYIRDVEESKQINKLKEPCIIISASGMIEAGRIKHHIANNIENEINTILIVGYAEPSSIAGQLRAGKSEIKIFGELKQVKAEVKTLDAYSAHADYEEMLSYISLLDKQELKSIFLVHGEYETQLEFKEKLLDEGYRNIKIPSLKETITL